MNVLQARNAQGKAWPIVDKAENVCRDGVEYQSGGRRRTVPASLLPLPRGTPPCSRRAASRGRPVREPGDEPAATRHGTFRLLSHVRPDQLSAPITMSDGSTRNVLDYIDMFAEHESMHAGQLVPASQARRFTAP